MQKTVYSYDADFKYMGEKMLDSSDRDPFGNFNIPNNCVEVEPLSAKEGFDVRWIGNKWEYKEIPKTPEPEPLTLDELKQQKIQEFRSLRDRDELAPVTTEKGTFDFDEKSLMRINEAKDVLAFAGEGATIGWTAADNTRVTMSYVDLMRIKATGAQRSNELHVKYNELKAEIQAATTVEELDAITW